MMLADAPSIFLFPVVSGPVITRQSEVMLPMTSQRLPLLLIAVLALASVLALTACSDDPEPTPTPTQTPVPTATPTATPTPVPTAPTAKPTAASTVTLPDPNKEPIIFSELPWESAQLQNRIAQYVIEYGYGHPTGVVSGSIPLLFEGLLRGDIDVNMEIWLPEPGCWRGTRPAAKAKS